MKRKKTETNLATREKDKFETIFILEKHEIGSQRLKLVRFIKPLFLGLRFIVQNTFLARHVLFGTRYSLEILE